MIYAVTNAFEGRSFVNVNNSAVETTTDYIRELLPTWNETQIAAAAAVYEGLGSVDTQAVGIYGESASYFRFDFIATLLLKSRRQ